MSDSQPRSRSESVERDESELPPNPQPPIQSPIPVQVFSPSRQHVGYPFIFAPANTNIYGMNRESEKFRKLMLKKQKRESRMPKNVLSEFKSEDISGHKFEDLDSVLQSLGEAEEEKKGKAKKKKKAESKKGHRRIPEVQGEGDEQAALRP